MIDHLCRTVKTLINSMVPENVYTSSVRLLAWGFESILSGLDLGLGFAVGIVTSIPPSSNVSGRCLLQAGGGLLSDFSHCSCPKGGGLSCVDCMSQKVFCYALLMSWL